MERSPKRPRLSMFDGADETLVDGELDSLRYRNDMLLKSRFEHIFEKYSRDFDGVGDEIDLETGEVVVDNGHIAAMASETDPGNPDDAKGKSLLRAMTEAPDREDSYFNEGADDVIASIETIAENVQVSGDDDEDEDAPEPNSDDELFTPAPTLPGARRSTVAPDYIESKTSFLHEPDPDETDRDSIFDVVRSQRSESPDSLFEVVHQKPPPETPSPSQQHADPLPIDDVTGDHVDEQMIMQKFGKTLGPEVLSIVEKARNAGQAHIEPVWRVPVLPRPPSLSRSKSQSSTPAQTAPSSELNQAVMSPGNKRSLWRPPPKRTTAATQKKQSYTARVMKRIRAESEDPLQEEFSVDPDTHAMPSVKDDAHPQEQDGTDAEDETDEDGLDSEGSKGESDPARNRKANGKDPPKTKTRKSKPDSLFDSEDDDAPEDERIKQLEEKVCWFCQRSWSSRAGVVNHWTRLIKQADKHGTDPEDHDMDWIRKFRGRRKVADRPPRLVVGDFKTMVELHEGAGISFAEIAECRVLRTQKMGPALVDVYDKYRSPPHYEKASNGPWSQQELDTLAQLAENPVRDLGVFARTLVHRTACEIGDKLAEGWLKQLRDTSTMSYVPAAVDMLREEQKEKERHVAEEKERQKIAWQKGKRLGATGYFIKTEPEADDES